MPRDSGRGPAPACTGSQRSIDERQAVPGRFADIAQRIIQARDITARHGTRLIAKLVLADAASLMLRGSCYERPFVSSLSRRTISVVLRMSASLKSAPIVDAIARNRALNSRYRASPLDVRRTSFD